MTWACHAGGTDIRVRRTSESVGHPSPSDIRVRRTSESVGHPSLRTELGAEGVPPTPAADGGSGAGWGGGGAGMGAWIRMGMGGGKLRRRARRWAEGMQADAVSEPVRENPWAAGHRIVPVGCGVFRWYFAWWACNGDARSLARAAHGGTHPRHSARIWGATATGLEVLLHRRAALGLWDLQYTTNKLTHTDSGACGE